MITYPEIMKLNLNDTMAAIRLGTLNLPALTDEARVEVEARIEALRAHAKQLRAATRQIETR